MLINVGLALLGNALGLIVAAWLLDDMALGASGFIIAVALFTLVEVIVQPLIVKISLSSAAALAGSSALIATLVGLIVTNIVSDSMSIKGFVTWLLATVIVWGVSMLGAFLLPLIFLRNRRDAGENTQGSKTWG
jgi:uncharacterized membrane protein YvlD (DUF360 family)